MNDLQKYITKLREYWDGRSKKQRIAIIGSTLGIIAVITVISILFTRTTMVPLYSDLSPSETGSIKESLDERRIKSEIADGGTTIKVPQEQVNTLKVELAAQGIPNSGSIDYSFFSQNAGIGMTENEFNVMKLDAMQTELANLIKGIEGVKDAKVMITLPEKSIFVTDEEAAASAAIILNTEAGYKFKPDQITALYHLVSKSVSNLPTDNIVIMNQYFEYFDLENRNNYSGDIFASQNAIKQEIERDLQREVQNMLGLLMGQDKVAVLVTTDIDFTQENREENLVLPVDEENMEGITISAQKITETYSGNGAEGVPSAEDPADSLGTSYVEGSTGNGDYERIEETINNEVNKIRKEIVESPYKIRDLGIQVMVEPPIADDPNSLPQERVEDIRKMLTTIVRTTIDKEAAGELTEESISDKIVVTAQPFNGKIQFEEDTKTSIPDWVFIVGGILIALILLLVVVFVLSRRKQKLIDENETLLEDTNLIDLPNVGEEQQETEASLRRKQLEKMAKDKPEEFSKLLRSWIAED